MKSKVKNFFLYNTFNLILLAGLMGVYIFYIVQKNYIIQASWYKPLLIDIVTDVILFIIMLIPIAFVIYKIIKSRKDTYEPYSLSKYIGCKILINLLLIVIYFAAFILLRVVLTIIIYFIYYSFAPCIIIV